MNQNDTWQVGARIYEAEDNGGEELPENVTLIYPNPASEYFNVLMTDPDRVYDSIRVYDPHGRMILQKPVAFGKTLVQITGYFTSGMYTVYFMKEGEEPLISKLIVVE